MRVGIVDYGMGNLRSVAKALEKAGASVTLTTEPNDVDGLDALCVPGQGIFGRCMDNLSTRGMTEALSDWIASGKSYLGICLGMQILFDESEERGPRAGLGIVAGRVTRLSSDRVVDRPGEFGPVRVPHIGWNTVSPGTASAGNGQGGYFYFDHSYAVRVANSGIVKGWCEHGETFAAEIATGSITAVQFHPEKSGDAGIEFLRGWVDSSSDRLDDRDRRKKT